jgi:hypothetical protein
MGILVSVRVILETSCFFLITVTSSRLEITRGTYFFLVFLQSTYDSPTVNPAHFLEQRAVVEQ